MGDYFQRDFVVGGFWEGDCVGGIFAGGFCRVTKLAYPLGGPTKKFFLFRTIFRRVPKKVEGFYFQKTFPLLEKVTVFGNRSIRQNFCFFFHKNVA